MPGPISQLRAAWNDTLVNYTGGADLDALASQLGLPRPSYISRTAWRRALEAAGYAQRGDPNITQFFLEGALSDYATTLSVVLDPSRPTQLYSPSAEFTQALVGRFVRIAAYGLFRVGGPEDVTATVGPNEILDLVAVANPAWDVPDWTTLTAPEAVDAEFLAFFPVENQAGPPSQALGDESGTLTVYVYPDVLEGVAPTFLLPYDTSIGVLNPLDYPDVVDGIVEYEVIPGNPPSVRPVGQPVGGYMLANAETDGEDGDDTGPYPLFLASNTVLGEVAAAMYNLLPTSLKVTFVRLPEVP